MNSNISSISEQFNNNILYAKKNYFLLENCSNKYFFMQAILKIMFNKLFIKSKILYTEKISIKKLFLSKERKKILYH